MKEARHKGRHIVWSYSYETFSIDKLEKESRLVVARGAGVGLGVITDGYGVSFWGDKMLKWEVIAVQLCDYTKKHWTVHLKGGTL